MTIASDYIELAELDIAEHGSVQESTTRSADCTALYGHRICAGIYTLIFSDGSRLNFNKTRNYLEAA